MKAFTKSWLVVGLLLAACGRTELETDGHETSGQVELGGATGTGGVSS